MAGQDRAYIGLLAWPNLHACRQIVGDPNASYEDVVRHEAAHIVTKVAGDGKIAQLPSWIDEGTAVYAQNGPGFGYQTALQRAIQSDQLLRLRNMQSATNQPDLVNLFYGESWAVVKFMVDTYGREKFAAVIREIREAAAELAQAGSGRPA